MAFATAFAAARAAEEAAVPRNGDEYLSLASSACGGARRARSASPPPLGLLCGVDRAAGRSDADGDFEDELGSPVAAYDNDGVLVACSLSLDSPSSMPAEWALRLSDDGLMAGIDIH